jgi:hypothetical protein
MQTDDPPPRVPFQSLPLVENASILTPTSGFLKTGYTHTINVYQRTDKALGNSRSVRGSAGRRPCFDRLRRVQRRWSPCQHGYKHVESVARFRKYLDTGFFTKSPLNDELILDTPNYPVYLYVVGLDRAGGSSSRCRSQFVPAQMFRFSGSLPDSISALLARSG